jgi:hypothetical protein
MASRAFWSAEEINLLERHAEDRNWFGKVRSHMPGRSEAAIRKQMFNLRTELGMVDRRVSTPWMRDAARGTRALLLALQAAGVTP